MTTKTKNIIAWILTGILALAFFGAGITKALGVEMQLKNIESWQLPLWTRYPIGIGEIILAIGLVLPRFRKLTLYAVFIWTVVAVITHLRVGQVNMLAPSIIFSVVAAVILWLSKENKLSDNHPSIQ